jgi:hypothetical protein
MKTVRRKHIFNVKKKQNNNKREQKTKSLSREIKKGEPKKRASLSKCAFASSSILHSIGQNPHYRFVSLSLSLNPAPEVKRRHEATLEGGKARNALR